MQGSSGQFDKTVMLRSFSDGAKDSFGHKPRTFADVRKCAARRWQRTATQLENAPAEFPAGTLRLLLNLPPADLGVGWQVVYLSNPYTIVDLEWREMDTQCLVTLEPA